MHYMKKVIWIIFLSLFAFRLKAQVIRQLPQFRLLKNDSTFITQANLKTNTKTMVVVFGTDCIHCQLYTKELLKHTDELSKIQVLMITWSQLKSIQAFVKEYGLDKHPNFIVATEGPSANLYRLFQVKTTPYTAIYDKNRLLVKVYDKSPIIDSLLSVVKQ